MSDERVPVEVGQVRRDDDGATWRVTGLGETRAFVRSGDPRDDVEYTSTIAALAGWPIVVPLPEPMELVIESHERFDWTIEVMGAESALPMLPGSRWKVRIEFLERIR